MRKRSAKKDRQMKLLLLAAGILAIVLLSMIISVTLANFRRDQRSQQITPQESATVALVTETSIPITPTAFSTELPTETPEPSATPLPQLNAEDWKSWPTLPDRISDAMRAVYLGGKENGNRDNAFSKVGDSNSMMPSFLSCFDYGEAGYTIGKYTALDEAINHFQGSFARNSRSTANGITAMGLDTYHWYEDDVCWPYESATSCEYRLWQPSIAFVSLGTNDAFMPIADFERHLRSLVQKSLDRFVVPILVTKADDIEKDGSFNRMIAQIAADFEVPLWNLWRAMEPLPGHGLLENDVHPTFNEPELCDFSGDDLQKYGWTVRNLSALEALDRVWRLLNDMPLQ